MKRNSFCPKILFLRLLYRSAAPRQSLCALRAPPACAMSDRPDASAGAPSEALSLYVAPPSSAPAPTSSDASPLPLASGATAMTGIMNWSLTHSDGTRPSKPISDEDKRFFFDALASVSVDPVARMRDISSSLATLPGGGAAQLTQPALDATLLQLEELQDHAEDIDAACDFPKVGGLPPLLALLSSSPHASLRAASAGILSTVAANNPKAQASMVAGHAVGPLVASLSADADAGVRAKAALALSSLLRNCRGAQAAFGLAGGHAALLRACGAPPALPAQPAAEPASADAAPPTTVSPPSSTPSYSAAPAAAPAPAAVVATTRRRALSLALHLAEEEAHLAVLVNLGAVRVAASCLAPSDGTEVAVASLNLLLHIARCADFDALPKAVEHLRAPGLEAALRRIVAKGAESEADAGVGEEEEEDVGEAGLAAALLRMLQPGGDAAARV